MNAHYQIQKQSSIALFIFFVSVTLFGQGLIPFSLNGKIGYLNEDLSVCISPRYTQIQKFTAEGYAAVRYSTYSSAVIDVSGKEIILLDSPGVVHLLDDAFGYYDSTGKSIIRVSNGRIVAQKLLSIGEGSEGLIPVKVLSNGRCAGYINLDGTIFFNELSLRDTNKFVNGLATVVLSDWNSAIIDKNGKLLGDYEFLRLGNTFSEGLLFAQSLDKKTGYVDRTGRFVFMIPIIVSEDMTASDFSNGHAVIQIATNPNTWRIINTEGKFISEKLFFDSVSNFVEGYSQVAKFDEISKVYKYGFINTNGEMLVNPSFEKADDFCNGYARIILNGREGLLSQKAKIIWSDEIVIH